MEKRIEIYDATLRHTLGSSETEYSLEDRMRIINTLDNLGVTYIEIGAPGEHPELLPAYKRMATMPLQNARLVTAGGMRAKDRTAAEDPGCKAMLMTGTDVVALWGQACDKMVREDKRVSLEENLHMIVDTINFFKRNGRMVIFQASHFFEGYRSNLTYARDVVRAAQSAGADRIVLCESGLGTFPHEVFPVVNAMVNEVKVKLGIHCHDSMSCAVANSLTAVRAGVTMVQGTLLGIELGCGNTNLSTMLPVLQLLQGYTCIQASKMQELTTVTNFVAEICNHTISDSAPFVGKDAFSFRYNPAMDHYNGQEDPTTIQPEMVGNSHAGSHSRARNRERLQELVHKVNPFVTREQLQSPALEKAYQQRIKQGYQYASAEASQVLFVLRELELLQSHYQITSLRVLDEISETAGEKSVVAYLKLKSEGIERFAAMEGRGLVSTIWDVLGEGLSYFFPGVKKLRVVNYRIRLTDTNPKYPRVSLDITDGRSRWSTAGISNDLVGAVFAAAQDAYDYGLLLDEVNGAMH